LLVDRMAPRTAAPNWKSWLASWDRQQEAFNPTREVRFQTMFDVLEARLGRRFTALDLGCGPGSLSVRLLRRFPRARVVAVDYDPVVRQVGRGALGDVRGRMTWVDAKLGADGWTDALPVRKFDAALSTTALHWLTAPDLRRLYADLGRLIRRRGVFLNGDYLPFSPERGPMGRLSRSVLDLRYPPGRRSAEWGGWKVWWAKARKVPALREAFREHDRREAAHPSRSGTALDVHVRALRRAGFRTVEPIWSIFENRILYAER
jgi:SAM-dependent methyltransferase